MRYRLLILFTAIALIASGCNLYTWGTNTDGQLATDNPADTLTPTNQNTDVAVYSDWDQIAPGWRHTCGIRQVTDNTGGTLWCWGQNAGAGLGPDVFSRRIPTQVGIATSWTAITAGATHSCGVQTDSSLWCWGNNTSGQLGTGDTAATLYPTLIAPGTSWLKVNAGDDHTCGIQADQSLWCWGSTANGATGTGSASSLLLAPTSVGNVAINWTALDAAPSGACGVRGNDTLWCWGRNSNGRIGDGTTIDRETPTRVGLESDWDSVSTGAASTCGLQSDAVLSCWGATGGTTPTAIPAAAGGWSEVGAEYGACGIQIDDSLWCWVSNGAPTKEGQATWRSLQAGRNGYCGTHHNGSGWCLAFDNVFGQSGDGTSAQFSGETFQRVGADDDFGYPFTVNQEQVSAGGQGTCGIRSRAGDGAVWCWGANQSGQLGNQSTVGSGTPVLAEDLSNFRSISVGGSHACAIAWNGDYNDLRCWGDNADHQVIDMFSTTADIDPYYDQPRSIPYGDGSQDQWTTVSAGDRHTCATRFELGANEGVYLYCWGADESGQLGSGTPGPGANPLVGFTHDLPDRIPVGTASNWASVSAGTTHTCGTQGIGSLWCWGSNAGGRLGDGTTTQRLTPVQVGTATNWTQVDAGGTHTCAIKTNGQLWCWGTNNRGQLGLGDTTNRLTPTRVGTASNWTHVTTGFNFTCGLRTAPIGHDLYCWGANNNGRLGDGTTTQRNTPVEIGAGTNWATVDAGDGHVAATRVD